MYWDTSRDRIPQVRLSRVPPSFAGSRGYISGHVAVGPRLAKESTADRCLWFGCITQALNPACSEFYGVDLRYWSADHYDAESR